LIRHRSLRWLVPVGVLGVVGLAAGGMMTARATPDPLRPTTTAQLLADVQAANVPGLSGTIVAQMSLGLPALPALSTPEGSDTSITGLLSGSHTMRFWYGGPDRQRIALLGVTSETDVFHLGSDVWEWDSDAHVATHTVLPKRGAGQAPPLPTSTTELTPQQLATQFLSAINPSTKVTMGAKRVVADRSAYDLVLTPRDAASRVGSVHIAVDGSTKTPLGVQVYPTGSTAPAIDVAFSSVTFKTPSAGYFAFTPPPGATVRQGKVPATNSPQSSEASGASGASDKVTAIGTGWTTIGEYRATPKQVAAVAGSGLNVLTKVSGAWGSGRLLDSKLFSALVTDDGRVFVGAVDPAALYAAATTHK
jgi:outer membrane lipoprotein-sorting protein